MRQISRIRRCLGSDVPELERHAGRLPGLAEPRPQAIGPQWLAIIILNQERAHTGCTLPRSSALINAAFKYESSRSTTLNWRICSSGFSFFHVPILASLLNIARMYASSRPFSLKPFA